MPRRRARPQPDRTLDLFCQARECPSCARPLWAANIAHRTVTTLEGLVRLRLQVRSCRAPGCPRRGAAAGLSTTLGLDRLDDLLARRSPRQPADGSDALVRLSAALPYPRTAEPVRSKFSTCSRRR